MNKAEINEIKKLYKINNCSVTRICGCYVNGDKDIINTWNKNFLSMDEEDMFKYLDIFKKCLSGGVNKTMFNIRPGEKTCEELHQLTQSKLQDDEMLMKFYERIIDGYEYVGNYLILVIHDAYDIPGKASDNTEMEDASDEVYEYIMACICPVNLSKPGLGYDKEKSIFTHLERDWVMNGPEMAVLYPAFNDRSEDREAALYYVKSMDDDKKTFAAWTMGAVIEWTPEEEKDIFQRVIEQTLGYDKSIQDIRNVNEMTLRMAEDMSDKQEEEKIGIEDIRKILRAAGVREERIGMLDRIFAEEVGDKESEIAINNVVNRRSFTVRTDHGTVSMKQENAKNIEIRNIDGEACIVLRLDGDTVDVNGMEVNIQRFRENSNLVN